MSRVREYGSTLEAWVGERPESVSGLVVKYFIATSNYSFNALSRCASPAGRFLEIIAPGFDREHSLTEYDYEGPITRTGQVAADFDAADCARFREYAAVTRGMLSDDALDEFRVYVSGYLWSGIDGVRSSSLTHDAAAFWRAGIYSWDSVAGAVLTVFPAAMENYVYRSVLAAGGARAAFVAVALVIVDAAVDSWDPYLTGRAGSGTDCACALCSGEWPDNLPLGPCGCAPGQCPRTWGFRSYCLFIDMDSRDARRCAPPDWGAILAAPAAAAAVAHAAEAICPARRAAWDARSPAVAAVECGEAWWTDLGLRPPEPMHLPSSLRFAD